MSEESESFPAIGQALGPSHVEIGTVPEPYPAVVLIVTWPESPGHGIDVRLTPDEARELAGGAEEAAELVDDMLDAL